MKKSLLMTLTLISLSASADDALVQACQQALRAGDFDKAASAALQAIKESSGNRDAHLCLGRAKGQSGDHAAAVAALETADKYSSTPIAHMQALTLLGHEHKQAGAYSEARATYQKSLALAKSERNQYFQRANLVAIGEATQSEGRSKDALEVYQQSMKLAANDNERADCHAHLASAYNALGNHNDAISHQIKATVMEERSGDLDHYAKANLDLGRYYGDAKEYPNAERTLTKLLEVIKQNGDLYWEARIYQLQAQLAQAQGKAEEGSQYRQRALDLANKIGATDLARDIETTK